MEHKRILRYLLLTLLVSMFGFGKASAAAYAEFRGSTLYFYDDNKRGTRTGVTYDLNVGTNYPGWYSDGTNAKVKQVFFTSSFFSARPTSTYHWFDGMENLKDISAIENLVTSEVTDMTGMFASCGGSIWENSLDLTLNTEKVKCMAAMFSKSKFKTLNLNFSTGNVTDMSGMFNGCTNLERIFVGDGWNTDAVTSSAYMFQNCVKLVGGEGTVYNSQYWDKIYARVDGVMSNSGYLSEKGKPYAHILNGTMTFRLDENRYDLEGHTYRLNEANYAPGWRRAEDWATTVVFDPSFANARPTSTYDWFELMENLVEIRGMAEYLNTSEVTNMRAMFHACKSLETIDLSGFNTSKVTDMSQMFFDCDGLTTLDLRSFDTRKVTDMSSMFLDCDALTTIYAGYYWNTDKVTNSTNMFLFCPNLVGGMGTCYNSDNRDVSYAHPDGGEANPGYLSTKMMYVAVEGETMKFYYDGNFYKRAEPVYDVNDLLSASRDDHAFDDVVTAEFDPSFADARPTYTGGWFDSMPKLSTFKGMNEYLNTSEVRSMRGMFNYLLYVEKLDLSGFDTHNVQDMTAMFGNNFYLETIWVGDGWNTDNVIESTGMFSSCRRLVGGAGTKWDERHTDVRYAHVDGGWTNPGYFTKALKGDVNNDGAVDVADIGAIIDVMAGNGQEFKSRADVNGDNTVDVADIGAVIDIMAGK